MRRNPSAKIYARRWAEHSRQLQRAAAPKPCACPSIAECAAGVFGPHSKCPYCAEAIAAGMDPKRPVCAVPGSPCNGPAVQP